MKTPTVHFLTLNRWISFSAAVYAAEVGILREEFKSRFQDFRKHETSFKILASLYETMTRLCQKNYKSSSQICGEEIK